MKANRKFSELRAEIAADPIRAERLDRAREEVNRTYDAKRDLENDEHPH